MPRTSPLALAALLVSLASLSAQAAPIDEAPISSPDRLSREIGMGVGGTVLDFQTDRGPWLGTYANGGTIAPDSAQGADYATRGLSIGYGLGWHGLAPFIGYAQGQSDLDDGVTQTRIRSYFIGLGLSGERGRFSYDAALYAGRTHNKIESPVALTGAADFDGQLLGLSLRGGSLLWQNPTANYGVDLVVQGDFVRHTTESHPITGVPGGRVSERTTTSSALRLEMGVPMERNGASIRPYLALSAFGGTPDDITFSVGGISTSFDPADVSGGGALSLGTSFVTGDGGLKGRVELSRDAEGETLWGLRLGMAF
ncbi:autotransporter outer membrane beta-barrel domain-containing protein [Antarctobacter sp.]|uniref:autotransporter outer membrane beta-barrel domain-containing protein n=1 Tax=Antarctobacter sp. TaxID=1872577 RepID=UPI002B26A8D8|nr:autotransporter outer membrane beta-barrel domain-containing protein [Antarctobacter sp.]